MSQLENGYTNIRRAASGDEDILIVEKQGFIGIPLKKDEAEYVCRTLALYMGLSIVDQRENILMLTKNANVNSTKENPLGDISEEHS
jgi:hypothetical protein